VQQRSAHGRTAVTGNLTVTGQTSSGYCSSALPLPTTRAARLLNFPVGDDRANAVTVALGAGGTLSITFVAPSSGPTAQAIFDVTGYFTPDRSGATITPLHPPGRSIPVTAQADCLVPSSTMTPESSRCWRTFGGHSRHWQPDRDRPDLQRLSLHRSGRDEQPDQLDSQLPSR